MFNGKHHSEIKKCQKYLPLDFSFHSKIKVNRGAVVGDDGSVL